MWSKVGRPSECRERERINKGSRGRFKIKRDVLSQGLDYQREIALTHTLELEDFLGDAAGVCACDCEGVHVSRWTRRGKNGQMNSGVARK